MLLTMLTEDGKRTRSHGLPRAIIEAQANTMGLELLTAPASWTDYRGAFISLLKRASRNGIRDVVFGDIDIPSHREWEEGVSRTANVRSHLPLWQEDRRGLLQEWWSLGFEARIIVVRENVVSRKLLGTRLNPSTVEYLERQGVDACGENGEFHTLVTDGPLFHQPLRVSIGQQVKRGGCWVQDVVLERTWLSTSDLLGNSRNPENPYQ